MKTLTELLEDGILYAEAVGQAGWQSTGAGLSMVWRTFMPEVIRLFCQSEKCSTVIDWRIKDQYGTNPTSLYDAGRFTYACVQCGREVTFYAHVVDQNQNEGTATVQLVGRFPRAHRLAGQQVAAAMGEIDRHLYERALSDRADGAGIGAMAYMRRVVENEMNRLLDLLIELLFGRRSR